ncbi:hypothetical protein MNBD_CHLOROFLEXI01-1939 [hydrothermal vent metagenome]|uniref:Uncharacterized protein n=1 Tax=hydrothermal vent metagenome TaxID=652676 RepID=A0A3B0V1Q5_9ZZZZ
MTLQYIARKIADLNESNTWTRIQVGVFEVRDGVESQVGEYIRNYGLMRTFFHFQKNGKDYALYSPDYTCTRLMELPSCRDLGGEEPAGNGFCPVEYYVPCYIEREYEGVDGKRHRYLAIDPQSKDFEPSTDFRYPLDLVTGEREKIETPNILITPLTYMLFGFVSGCFWGDDSSWKVQVLDLSQAAKGIISREERFGYLPLPDKLSLKDSIDLINFELGEENWDITIATQRSFEFKTGKEN